MSPRILMGIDPGLHGAVAFIVSHDLGLLSAFDMPTVANEIDAAGIARLIETTRPDDAFIERVGSRPGQGVASSFKFGKGFGTLLGVLAALKVPATLVTPQSWKKHYRLSSDKEASRLRALELWPGRAELFTLKKHEARAEAALIARYGLHIEGGVL